MIEMIVAATFAQVEAAPHESVSAPALVAGAYGFIWLAAMLYLGLLWRRSRRIADDLQALERRIQGEARAAGESRGG
jgi:hypothetical protein